MYELYPYFTNDGSVGLFSRQDDDIYHSTYGALTESWEKFILPAHFEQYINTHPSVKILDICYGIGYNSKTALNVFLKNLFKNNKTKFKKNINNSIKLNNSIGTIYSNNTQGKKIEEKSRSKDENHRQSSIDSCAIYSDNTQQQDNAKLSVNDANFSRKLNAECSRLSYCNQIKIDAVDLDKILIHLSPFIAEANIKKKDNTISDLPSVNKIKSNQIKSIKNSKRKLKKEYKLLKEVSIILFLKLFKQNPEIINDSILNVILTHKKYSPFISKFMVNLMKFYGNLGYYCVKIKNNLPFLHNIYYRYVSKSYKNAIFALKNSKIDINFHKNDAREFVKTTTEKYNFIFLDAFTPLKSPSLWTVHFLRELFTILEDDGMILTYSNSAAVRNAFLQAGFHVGKTFDKSSNKFVGTVATKNKGLIDVSLDDKDMDLINSRAGICFKDEHLELDNDAIIARRDAEVKSSELLSSSKVLKGYNNDKIQVL